MRSLCFTYPYIKEISKILTSEIGGIGHAGELETLLFLYLYPELVRRDKMTKEIPKQLNNLGTDSRTPKNVHFGWFKLILVERVIYSRLWTTQFC
ncbi:MAG: hypothetical protein J7L47_03050 [Candidatus Odinarchaeota archaeon]|nr:hypothetical protein [Candidatus Odinarchaeota archaeon]